MRRIHVENYCNYRQGVQGNFRSRFLRDVQHLAGGAPGLNIQPIKGREEVSPVSPVFTDAPCRNPRTTTNQRKFVSEMALHFGGLKNIDKPIVRVFPEVVVCLRCGRAEFVVPKTQLHRLANDDGIVS